MKLSYQKRWGLDGTVYTQAISMTREQYKHLLGAFDAEVAQGLPRKREYIQTSGYECFMTSPKLTHTTERVNMVFLNHTQTRFTNLFTKLPLKDRNTCIILIK